MKTSRPKSSSKDHLKQLPSDALIARILELKDRVFDEAEQIAATQL